MPIGFNDAIHNWTPENALKARSVGARTARVSIDPQGVIENGGWDVQDRAIANIRAAGLKPMITIPSKNIESGPEWKKWVQDIVSRYPGAKFQIGNEPNLAGMGLEPIREYTRGLKQAEKVIHRLQPRAKVIAAATSPAGPRKARYDRKIAKAIRDRKIAMAVHLYPRSIKAAKRQYDRVDRKTKNPIYVTEAGFSSVDGEERQARRSARLQRVLADRGARETIYHSLTPGDGGWGVPNPRMAGYSFFDPAGNPKAVATRFQSAARRLRRR